MPEGGSAESRTRLFLKSLLALAVFTLATPWLLRPWFLGHDLLPESSLTLGLMEDTDLFLNIWILGWIARAVNEFPGLIFGGNIFYPTPNAIAGSENMLAHIPFTAAVWALTEQALLVFKAMVWESFALSGLAMWAFVYFHTRSFAAALIAGASFTFAPWRVQNVPHPQYLGFGYLPLALLGVDLWLVDRRRRGLVVLALGLALQALACLYLGYFTFLLVPLYVLVRLGQTPEHRGSAALGLFLAGLAGVLCTLPVAFPYLAARDSGMISAWNIAASGDWSFEWWWYLGSPFLFRVGWPLLALLAADAILRVASRRRVARRSLGPVEVALWWMVLGAAWLSTGPAPELWGAWSLPTPYGLLQDWVPGFAQLRGPGRFFMMVAAGLAALSGFAAQRLLTHAPDWLRFAAPVAGLAAFLVVAAPMPARVVSAALAPGAVEPVYELLRDRNGEGGVLELPAAVTENDILGNYRNARYMMASTTHWRPLLNGVTGHNPDLANLYDSLTRRLPDPEAWAALIGIVDIDVLVVHEARMKDYRPYERRWGGRLPPGLRRVAVFGDSTVFAVETPAPDGWYETLMGQASGEDARTFAGRSRAELPPACRGAAITLVDTPPVVAMAPVPLVLDVTFENQSECDWPGFAVRDRGLVGLSYQWIRPDGVSVTYPGPAFSRLIRDVRAGETVKSSVVVQPASGPEGLWTLEVQLVQNGTGSPLAVSRHAVELRAFAAPTKSGDPLPTAGR